MHTNPTAAKTEELCRGLKDFLLEMLGLQREDNED